MSETLSVPLLRACFHMVSYLQPSDFAMVRARRAVQGEIPRGANKHLILEKDIPCATFYSRLADLYGIVVLKVEPEVLAFSPADVGGGAGAGAPSQQWPQFLSPTAPCNTDERLQVVQLWGLRHCVTPLLERLSPTKWQTTIRIGAAETGTLKKTLFESHGSARVSALHCLAARALACLLAALAGGLAKQKPCTPWTSGLVWNGVIVWRLCNRHILSFDGGGRRMWLLDIDMHEFRLTRVSF